MEAAWQFLKRPKDEQKLAQLKLDMIRRLLKRNLSKDRIKVIIGFISLYVDFENSEIKTKFEQDLMVITKATQPMGFEQAIQEEFKKQGLEQGLEIGIEQGIEQGIEIGEAKRDEELLNNAVPELMQEGFSAERIAAILNLPLESVQAAIERAAQDSNNTPNQN
jgi:predicted transposase YdaD